MALKKAYYAPLLINNNNNSLYAFYVKYLINNPNLGIKDPKYIKLGEKSNNLKGHFKDSL